MNEINYYVYLGMCDNASKVALEEARSVSATGAGAKIYKKVYEEAIV